jgi:hypothetical protein
MEGPGVSERIPDKAAALRLMRMTLALREKLLLLHPVTAAFSRPAPVAPFRLTDSPCPPSFPESRIGAVADPRKSAGTDGVKSACGWRRQQPYRGAQLALMVSLPALHMTSCPPH